MSKQWVELTKDLWLDPDEVVRVSPIGDKAGSSRCRVYLKGATTGIPVELTVEAVMGLLNPVNKGEPAKGAESWHMVGICHSEHCSLDSMTVTFDGPFPATINAKEWQYDPMQFVCAQCGGAMDWRAF